MGSDIVKNLLFKFTVKLACAPHLFGFGVSSGRM